MSELYHELPEYVKDTV